MSGSKTIVVVDYGMGNLHSVAKALEFVAPEYEVRVTSDPGLVSSAGRVVFPGQGAMPDCMAELDARGLRAAVLDAAATKPFLGICVGLQMLFEHSEEGDVAGLGVFPGEVRRFDFSGQADQGTRRLKIPHMGWNRVEQNPQCRPHPLFAGIAGDERFYFVHSYFVAPREPGLTIGFTDYGFSFTSAVAVDNIFAIQCHPEKSAGAGLRLLRNFTQWNP